MSRTHAASARAGGWIRASIVALCAIVGLVACQRTVPEIEPLDAAMAAPPALVVDAGPHQKMGGAAPSGTAGFEFASGGFLQPTVTGPATQAGTAVNQFLYGYCDAGGVPNVCWSTITLDQIGAAFSVSLAAVGGGTFEVGANCSVTYNATPQASSGTVVHPSTWADNQGNSTTTSASNALASPNGGGAYTLNAPGTVTATITETQVSPSVTVAKSTTGCTFDYRYFYGVDSHSGGNAITASSTNATLSGGSASATLTGALFGSGTTNYVGLAFPSISPSSQYIYLVVPHTATAHTFLDQHGLGFDVGGAPVVSNYAFTNVNGVNPIFVDIYRSLNPLSTPYTITITAQNDNGRPGEWWADGPANDNREREPAEVAA